LETRQPILAVFAALLESASCRSPIAAMTKAAALVCTGAVPETFCSKELTREGGSRGVRPRVDEYRALAGRLAQVCGETLGERPAASAKKRGRALFR